MLETLQREGHQLGDKELARVRKKNGMSMRANNAKEGSAPLKRKQSDLDQLADQIAEAAGVNDESQEATEIALEPADPTLPQLPPEVVEERQRHREALYAESQERYEKKTRRRRTRPWAGLPADPPGPPRFPSETTIDEAKQILGIDHNTYLQIRRDSERICLEEGVRRKVEAGAEKWRHVLERMIVENHHLSSIFHSPHIIDHRDHMLAVEVIANDVTKRMRTQENKMTIQDCKNILQVNPEEARQLRKSFEDILRADNFTNKFEAGAEHWNELKQQWIDNSPALMKLIAPGTPEPDINARTKAMELLCRDVMKRYRDNNKRIASNKEQQPTRASSGATKIASRALAASSEASSLPLVPSPSPFPPQLSADFMPSNGEHVLQTTAPNIYIPNAVSSQVQIPMPPSFDYSNLQIDPELLLAANDPSRLGAYTGPP